MEENQGETQTQVVQETTHTTESSSSGVSFPTVGQPKKSGGPKTLLVLGVLVLLGILGFVIFKNSSKKVEPEPTSSSTLTPVEMLSPSASSTAKPADKSKVKIQIQNGTGITGEAAFLQTQLKTLGYTTVTVGNASSQDQTVTTVTFAKSLSSDSVDELTKKLKELYKEVEVKTVATSTNDVVIITGLRKGATVKPSATPTLKTSASPTVKASSSPTPTPTPTST
ncbi:MAG: LytR C-terminal domain-containing protein [Patescibacteria group bacterium]